MAEQNDLYAQLENIDIHANEETAVNILLALAEQTSDYPFDQMEKLNQFINSFGDNIPAEQKAAIDKIKSRIQIQTKKLNNAQQNLQIENLNAITTGGAVFLQNSVNVLQNAGVKIPAELQDKIAQCLQEFDTANNLADYSNLAAEQMDAHESQWRRLISPIVADIQAAPSNKYSAEELEVFANLAIQHLKINSPHQDTNSAQVQFINEYKDIIDQYEQQLQIEQANKLAMQKFAKKHKMTLEEVAELKIGVEKGFWDDEESKKKYAELAALRGKYIAKYMDGKSTKQIDADVKEAVLTSFVIQTETLAYRTAQITGAQNITPETQKFIQKFAAAHPKMYEYGKMAIIAGRKAVLSQAIGMISGVNGLAIYSAYNTYQSCRKAYEEFEKSTGQQGFGEFLKYLKQPENAQKRIDLMRQVAQSSISVGFAVAADITGTAFLPGSKWIASTVTNLTASGAKVAYAAKDMWKNRHDPEQKAKNKKILKKALIGLGIAALTAASFGIFKGDNSSEDDTNTNNDAPAPQNSEPTKVAAAADSEITPPEPEVAFTNVEDNDNLKFAVNATPTPTYHKLMEMGVLSEDKAKELMGGKSYIPSRVLQNYLENEAKFTPEQKTEFENFFNDREARNAEFSADRARINAMHSQQNNADSASNTNFDAAQDDVSTTTAVASEHTEKNEQIVPTGETAEQKQITPQKTTLTVEEKKKYLFGLKSKLKNGEQVTVDDTGNPQTNASVAASQYNTQHGSSRVIVTDANGNKAEISFKNKTTDYGTRTKSSYTDLTSGEQKKVTTYADKQGNLIAATGKFRNSEIDAHTVGAADDQNPDTKLRSVVIGDQKYSLVKDGDTGKQYIVKNSVMHDQSGNVIYNDKHEPQLQRQVTQVDNGNKIMRQIAKQARQEAKNCK